MVVYHTLFNGGNAYQVSVNGKCVKVHASETDFDVYDVPVVQFSNAQKVFVGRDGDEANSVLVDIGNGVYAYIGEQVYAFKPDTPIVVYVSPVGNSGVTYPYAIDASGAFYLMNETVQIRGVPAVAHTEPYQYFYRAPKGSYTRLRGLYVIDRRMLD